jgi:hypothetical protein
MSLTFTDPPAPKAGRPTYMTAEIQEELRSNPDRWALVFPGAGRVQRNAVANWCHRHDGFEFTGRSAGVGQDSELFDLYVRYVGEDQR